jgi:hypothetical protein
VERGQCLSSIWKWPSLPVASGYAEAPQGPSAFDDRTYAVIRECIEREARARSAPGMSADIFSVIGNLAPEIRKWLMETFHIQQEVMTTALTFFGLFPHTPRVVGDERGSAWNVESDSFKKLTPGHRVRPLTRSNLVVVDEVRHNGLVQVWDKVLATARDHVVVMVLQER